jgi:hypothetical protein
MANLIESELIHLRAQRVGARRNIERSPLLFPDPIDRRQFVEAQMGFLRGSQNRWEELHAMLRRPLPGTPRRLR